MVVRDIAADFYGNLMFFVGNEMSQHVPVLLNEMLTMLAPRDGGIYFDGTFGGGGYTKAILETADCKVIAVDRDAHAITIADEFKNKYLSRFSFFHAKFGDIKTIIKTKLDGIVLDLGVSNFQLTDPSRGFSFNLSGPLDMRMGLCGDSALDVIRKYSEQNLANIIYELGEEHFSRRIAKNIKLNLSKIQSTENLADAIRSCVKRRGKTDPATKTFQALRIFVNKELEELKNILRDSVDLLNPNGKIIVVSFHSLEDRIVKFFFKELISSRKFRLLVKKPIAPSAEEILRNRKSRSAKLRGVCVLQEMVHINCFDSVY